MSFDPYSAVSGSAMRNVAGAASSQAGRGLAEGALSTRETLGRLAATLGHHLPLLVAALLLNVLGTAGQLYVPILIGRAIDCMVGPQAVDFASIRSLVGSCALVVLASAAALFCQSALTSRVAHRSAEELRVASFAKLGSVPVKTIDTHPHGDIMARITADADQVADGLLQGLSQLIGGITAIVATVAFMLATSHVMGLIVIALTPISMLVAAGIARASSKSFAQQQALQGELAGFAEEHLSNQLLVFAFGYEQRARRAYEEIDGRLYVAGEHAQFMSSLSNPGTRLANNLIYAVVAVLGASCVMGGWPTSLTLGQMQAFLSYATQYTKPFNEIAGVLTQVQAALASANRIFTLIDAEDETEGTQELALGEESASVEVRDVSFGYVPYNPVLRDISLAAAPGKRIALVGPTGCGKTTLINLMLRFYDPQEGAILIDGKDIQAMSRDSVRRSFGMVLQDTWLIEGTVADNIAYARPDATREEIERAAERAHAMGFIRLLPEGLDTMLGEGATRLSQGERQLLCIARVMLQDPPMLILDEATSAIDARTELLVTQAFEELMRGRTSIVVAHRLSTVRSADLICVMRDGAIVERGTHDELVAAGGFYARMLASANR